MQKKRNLSGLVELTLLALFLLAGTACTSSGQSPEKENFGNIDVQSARQMIEKNHNNPDFVLLDTRTQREYNKSHLKGAIFYNYNARNFWDQIKKLDKSKIYIVYCHSGSRSGNAVKFMKKNDFQEAYNIRGGIVAWKRAGFQVVSD